MSGAADVLGDWKAGLAHYHFWWRFGLLEIRLRYRRTVLGPLWVTMSFAASAAALSFVYSTLFKVETQSYIAYVVTGLAIWGLINALVVEGCVTFINQSHLIQQYRLPMLAYALRSVVVSFLVFAHNLLIVLAAVLFFGVDVGWRTLLAAPALVLILANGAWLALLLGMLSARFRDLVPLSALLVNVLFFVTPVFWYKEMLGPRGYVADFNPLYHLLEVARAPLMGQVPPAGSTVIVLGITALGWGITLLVATRLQPRLAYWV